MTRRVIVAGGRDYADRARVVQALEAVKRAAHALGDEVVIVHGAQEGADSLADDVAHELGLATEPHRADVARYGSPAAFHIRNQEIVDAGAALAIAFPGGTGTANLAKRATKAGIKVIHR